MSMLKGEKVLVTGGCGFIGSHLVKKLVALGAKVTVADDLSAGKIENVKEVLPKIEFYKWDLRDPFLARATCANTKYLFHLAANMGGIGYITTNAAILRDNLTIDVNMLQAARGYEVKRLLYPSSACIYPVYKQESSNVQPLKEEEFLPAQPDTLYGWEKLMAEMLFSTSFDARICRLHNVYGPYSSFGERGKAPMHLIMKAIKHPKPPFEIWGDGKQTRSFLYVDDCVDGLLKLMASGYRQPVNIGSDRMVTINELAEMIIRISGKDIKPSYDLSKPQGVRGRNADITLAKRVLGWKPKITLEEGLRRTYEWAEALAKNV